MNETIRGLLTKFGGLPVAVDQIADDNSLDMELYAYACQLYEERHP